MANTVNYLSYANTFGDQMVAINALALENNTLAKGNYFKDAGTLILQDPNSSLRVDGPATYFNSLEVTGVGSYVTIQRNLTVGRQVYFTNTTLGLTNSGQANIGGPLYALSSGNGIIASNNILVFGSSNVVSNSVVGGFITVTGNAAFRNTVSIVGNTYITSDLTVNRNARVQDLRSNTNALIGNYLNVVGSTYTDILQANSSVNTATLTVTGPAYANVLQANSSVNTRTLTVTGSAYVNILQANTSINTATFNATGSAYVNILQANTSVNTATFNATGSAYVNVLQANTSVNTRTLTVTDNAYVNVLQANNSVNTRTLTVTDNAYVNVLQANTSVNTRTLTVTDNAYVNVLQANTSVNTATLTVTGNTISNNLQANTSVNTAIMYVIDRAFLNNVQANVINSSGNVYVRGTSYLPVVQANTSVNTATFTANSITATSSLGTITAPYINVGTVLNGINSTGFFNNLDILNQLIVRGPFVITGQTIYNSDKFVINAGSASGINSAYEVYRGPSSISSPSSNAAIYWNEILGYWTIKDVSSNTYYKILTGQNLTDSYGSTAANTAASATALSSSTTNLQNQITSNTASLQSQISSNVTSLQSQITQNSTTLFAAVTASYARANTSSNTFVGTSGTAVSSSGVISLTSTNGVTVTGTSNTLTVNTPQDVRTSASPTFNSLTLTNPLALSQGGTGQTSSAGALNALLPTGTTSGYVLTTGGPGSFYWGPGGGGGGGATPGTAISTTRLSYVGDGSTTTFTTPTYITGSGQLRVYINGVRQFASEYVETSTVVVTMSVAPASGDSVLIEVDGYYVNPYYANNIAYTVNAGISGSANTIQLALDGIVSVFAPKASPSLTGTPLSTTAAVGTSTTQIATTAFVNNTLNNGTGTTYAHSITGNAGTVTNGVVTTGSYDNPTWITGLAGSKVTSIPNSSLTNSTLNINGTAISLGGGGTVTAAAGTLTGATLASGVTASSLTSVGTLTSLTVSNTISGSISGNAGSVTNGVYTVGDQEIGGNKTFTLPIIASITGNAARVTNGVYTTTDQTINGIKTFTSTISGTISNATNAVNATNATSATTAATATALDSNSDYSLRNLTASGTGSFSSSLSSGGNISASGTITAGSQFTGPGTGLTGTAASLTVGVASYASTAGQATNATNATNVNGGTVTASSISATGAITSSSTISSSGRITASGGLTTASTTTLGGGVTYAQRNVNIGVSEIAWIPTDQNTAFINLSDSSGNNGQNYSLVIRGIGNLSTTNQNLGQFNVFAAQSYFQGGVNAVGNVTAGYSDERLKTKLGNIESALDKVQQLSGFYYEANDVAQELGYESTREVGVSAQEVQKVMPEAVKPAPVDAEYLTVQYEKLVPLLIEAIKELKSEVDVLKGKIK